MCGRFVLTYAAEALARLFEAVPDNDLPQIPNHNVCPTDPVHAVISADGTRRLRRLRWGFVPHWAKALNDGPPLINARAETVAEKPAFRAAVRSRRCLIPATGFYEWTKAADGKRQPWFIHPYGPDPLAFAGIWQIWGDDGIATCAIVTTAANAEMSRLHHRMPVVVPPADHALWLGEAGHGAARLMTPMPAGSLGMYRVEPRLSRERASKALHEPS